MNCLMVALIGFQIRDDWWIGGFLVLLSTLGLYHCMRLFAKAIRSNAYRPTDAKICFHDRNEGKLQYEYSVKGKAFQSSRVQFGIGGFRLTDEVSIVDDGATIVYVDPSNPSNAVIIRGVTSITITMFLLYLALLVMGTLWLAGFGHWGSATPGGLL